MSQRWETGPRGAVIRNVPVAFLCLVGSCTRPVGGDLLVREFGAAAAGRDPPVGAGVRAAPRSGSGPRAGTGPRWRHSPKKPRETSR